MDTNEHKSLVEAQGAFTLIELLVVIAIIAILLGLLFSVGPGVLDRAKKVQAKNDLTQIVTAVNAFYTEYGRYPINSSITTDAAATFGGSTSSQALFDELRAKTASLNTRQILFISPPEDGSQASPKGKIGSDGQFHDPWSSAYLIRMDANYDNNVDNAYTDGSAGGDPSANYALRVGVIAWSLGKNGKLGGGQALDTRFGNEPGNSNTYTNSGDVISWQ
jgi:prepilin-type N-terminal cleavage/methylation domain-containing protein